MTLDVVTFGCRLNTSESTVMRARAAEAGLDDAILFNTCAVTGEAVRQARQAIRKARRDHPGRQIIVSGCAAQTEPETFAGMAEVDLVLGNAEKLAAESYTPGVPGGKVRVNDIFSVRETVPQIGFGARARAFVQIQNGCDHRCTFCIIPYGRGNARSVPEGAVVAEIRRLVEHGYREAVLTGVDITAWGGDLPRRPRLGTLVRTILKHVQGLERLRLSSIDSVEADADLMRTLAEEPRLMPHLHLSLQAGDDLVLKPMKRRHSRADAVHFCNAVRRLRPDVAFGADLIAGFPTETEAMFGNTLTAVEECGLTYLHVFPFSARPGTPAARMPQVPREVVKARAARLRQTGERALAARLSAEVGSARSVLAERPGFGHTEHFAPVRFEGGRTGAVLPVRISAARPNLLLGSILPDKA